MRPATKAKSSSDRRTASRSRGRNGATPWRQARGCGRRQMRRHGNDAIEIGIAIENAGGTGEHKRRDIPFGKSRRRLQQLENCPYGQLMFWRRRTSVSGIKLKTANVRPGVRLHIGGNGDGVIVAIHGGGWIRGGPDQFIPMFACWSAAGLCCVATEYRLRSSGATIYDSIDDTIDAVREVMRRYPLQPI